MITILLPAMDRSGPVRRVRCVREAKHDVSFILHTYFEIEILNFYAEISLDCNELVEHSERIC